MLLFPLADGLFLLKSLVLNEKNILVLTIKSGKQIVTQKLAKRNIREMYRVLRRRSENISHSKWELGMK